MFTSQACGVPEEIDIPCGRQTEKESQFREVGQLSTIWASVCSFSKDRSTSPLMSLEYYFKNLRCEHADATKLVLIRDNAAGLVRGSDQCDGRRRTRSSFFDLEDCAPLPPAAPQRVESWQSTQSLSDSLQSALTILGEAGDFRDEDGGENDDHVNEFRFPTTIAERRQPNRFNFAVAGDLRFTQGLPPPLPTRLQSPMFTTGKKGIARPTPMFVGK